MYTIKTQLRALYRDSINQMTAVYENIKVITYKNSFEHFRFSDLFFENGCRN